jgi:hypothetical protein
VTDTAVELKTVEPVQSAQPGQPAPVSDEQLVAMLVERARSEGLQLTGQGGLLQQLTKRVLESALEGEITDHLGYDKHDAVGRGSGNPRNGGRAKTVLTDVGPVEVKVPRDTSGTFEPRPDRDHVVPPCGVLMMPPTDDLAVDSLQSDHSQFLIDSRVVVGCRAADPGKPQAAEA